MRSSLLVLLGLLVASSALASGRSLRPSSAHSRRDAAPGSDDLFCENLCAAGSIVDTCDCDALANKTTPDDSDEETPEPAPETTPAPGPDKTTTDLCTHLCSINEGGAICHCEGQPPARSSSERKEEEQREDY